MTDTFHCPNCGAPLEHERDRDLVIRCPYCSSSVIVPEALRSAREPETPPPPVAAGSDLGSLIGQAAHLGEIARLIRSGRKIEAIKRYREISGLGLKEAKEAVEALEAGQPVTLISTGSTSGRAGNAEIPAINIDARAAARAATTVGAGIGCVGLLVTGLIVLGVVVPVLFALAQPGGPLFETWSRINPLAANRLLLSFGAEGTGPGLFQDPRQIAVDGDGYLYVADFDTGRIQRFDAEGNFQDLWVVGDNAIIQDLAADRQGQVYAVFGGDIVIYDGVSGERLDGVAYPAERPLRFEQAAIGADGSLVAIANSEDLVRFDRSGQVTLEIFDAVSSVSNDSELDAHVAVDGLGNLFILGTFNNAVFKFAPDGAFVTRFGTDGDEPGQFRAPSEVAVDGQGRIYVSDFKGIQVFDNDGRYLDVIPVQTFAYDLTFDDQGRLFVVTNMGRVAAYEVSLP